MNHKHIEASSLNVPHSLNPPHRVIHQHRTKLGNPMWGIIALVGTILSSLSSSPSALASSVSFSLDNSNVVLELIIPSSISLDLTPTSGTALGLVDLPIGVGTNSDYGYTLFMTASSDSLTRTSSITDGSSNVTTPTIGPVLITNSPSGYTLSQYESDATNTYTMNTWGYKLSTDTNYTPAPTSSTTIRTTAYPSNATSITIGSSSNASSNSGSNSSSGNSDNGSSNSSSGSSTGDVVLDLITKVDTTIPSGTYTTTINFTAITNMNKLYMQDFNKTTIATLLPRIGDETILYDIRDEKPYTVAHLADHNYWMTNNLDLCIGCTGTASLTSDNTDLSTTASGSGIYDTSLGYSYNSTTGVWTWTPAETAITSSHTISGTTVPNWSNEYYEPYSAEGGTVYVYTSGSDSADTIFTSLSQCTEARHTAADCAHYHVGNYYNWSAAVASNDSSSITQQYTIADNSICPAGWRLPIATNSTGTIREFGELLAAYGVTSTNSATSYADNGFNLMRSTPLFFVRGGRVYGETLYNRAGTGYYWSSVANYSANAYNLYFNSSDVYSADSYYRYFGFSVRCLAR